MRAGRTILSGPTRMMQSIYHAASNITSQPSHQKFQREKIVAISLLHYIQPMNSAWLPLAALHVGGWSSVRQEVPVMKTFSAEAAYSCQSAVASSLRWYVDLLPKLALGLLYHWPRRSIYLLPSKFSKVEEVFEVEQHTLASWYGQSRCLGWQS